MNETADGRGGRIQALFAVIDQTRLLMHRLRVVTEEIHGTELSGGRRGVLTDLYRRGPQTVPQLARARPVSRQHIQSHVNPLSDEGYVELIDNPAHKRSKLVRLTAKGRDAIERMQRHEVEVLRALELDASDDELRAAAAVLSGLREAFASQQWRGGGSRE